ncbi:MAG: CAP domain-containing protein [Oscillospiraceae bacterium]
MINDYRRSESLEPFIRNEKLDKAAAFHAEYMCKNNILTHEGGTSSTESAGQRIKMYDYEWSDIAENVAQLPNVDAPRAFEAWRKSPGHNANMLSINIETGYAYCTGGNKQIYYCNVFAVPMNGLPNDNSKSKPSNKDAKPSNSGAKPGNADAKPSNSDAKPSNLNKTNDKQKPENQNNSEPDQPKYPPKEPGQPKYPPKEPGQPKYQPKNNDQSPYLPDKSKSSPKNNADNQYCNKKPEISTAKSTDPPAPSEMPDCNDVKN